MGVKSAIGIPIKKDNKFWGALNLTDYNSYRHWTEEDIIFIKAVEDQIYTAINQAELYEKEKENS